MTPRNPTPTPPPDGGDNGGGDARGTVNPMALSVDAAAKLLGVAPEVIRRHIAEGAPASGASRASGGGDGVLNLVHYAAWLNQRLNRRDGDGA